MEVSKINSIAMIKKRFTNNLSKSFCAVENNNANTLNFDCFQPSFTANPLKLALDVTELGKKRFYESKGIKYLLPSEVWSDKKILETAFSANRQLTMLLKSNTLNKQTLQEVVNNLIPDLIKGKILVNDIKELPSDTPDIYRNSAAAITRTNNEFSTMYINFDRANGSKEDIVTLKSNIIHELIHCLSDNLRNTARVDSTFKQNSLFNQIFRYFESVYPAVGDIIQLEPNNENMLKWLGFSSIDNLHRHFELVFNNIISRIDSSSTLALDITPINLKKMFSALKHIAADEKLAYKSDQILREYFDDLNTPTNMELRTLLRGEMEKFFEKKKSEIKC